LASWELSREFQFTDVDGRRPDWGRYSIDWTAHPRSLLEMFTTGLDLQIAWLETVLARSREFRAKLPS
jgi:hypothetical protein